MMHPPTLASHSDAPSSHRNSRAETGWVARVCRWVAALAGANAGAARTAGIEIARLTPQAWVSPISDEAFKCHLNGRSVDNVLSFPETEWSSLTRLAREVASQCGAVSGDDFDAGCMRIAPGTPLKLWIDRTAYAEIVSSNRIYRVVLGVNLPTRISLETSDFGEACGFIRDYVLATGTRFAAGDRA